MKFKKLAAAVCAAALSLTVMSVTAFAAEGDVDINETNFPDENFRAYVSENCDTSKDGKLSADEIAAVTRIDCSESQITSLKGIETFTALVSLNCEENALTELDISKNTELSYIRCYGNQIKELDITNDPVLVSYYAQDEYSGVINGITIKQYGLNEYDNDRLCNMVIDAHTTIISNSAQEENKPDTEKVDEQDFEEPAMTPSAEVAVPETPAVEEEAISESPELAQVQAADTKKDDDDDDDKSSAGAVAGIAIAGVAVVGLSVAGVALAKKNKK